MWVPKTLTSIPGIYLADFLLLFFSVDVLIISLAVYVYGCTRCFILAACCNIVFVHFKSAPPRNTLFSGGKACVNTTVPGNLLFDISVYSLHQFINWDFVANACNSGRIAGLKIYLDKTKPFELFVCFTFKSFITSFQMKFCETFTYILCLWQ